MRTNIVIDDTLMHEALKARGLTTKKEAVEMGLKLLVKQNKQQALKKLSCLCGSEQDKDGNIIQVYFLSCLCGSERTIKRL